VATGDQYPPAIYPKRYKTAFQIMWEEASKKVDEEEALIAEHTDPLNQRIGELEAMLGFFLKDRDESGCVNCPFSIPDMYRHCDIDDEQTRPCRIKWNVWLKQYADAQQQLRMAV